MMRFTAIAAIALGLSGGIAAAQDDWGGSSTERRLEIGELIFNDEVICRPTVCASSCTRYLVLGAERFGTRPDASIGFHSAYSPETGEVNERMTRDMVSSYPQGLQEWFWRVVYGSEGNEVVWISGATIIANGWAHEC